MTLFSRYQDQVIERYVKEAVQVTAVLRLPLVALIALLGPVIPVRDHWLPFLFQGLLVAYGAAAAGWLWWVFKRPIGQWAGWSSTVFDLLALLTLCAASGGATSLLLPVFFLLPVAVAFLYRPGLTATLGVGVAVGYLAVWLLFVVRDDDVDLHIEVYLYFGFLLWLAAATTGLSFVLVRRSATVAALLETREQLVTQSMGTEERERQRLAEALHDGPLQNILAARMDLEEALEKHADPSVAAAESTLRETAAQLRSTVTSLHPQVLAQLGLTPALRELAEQYARRGGYELRMRLTDVSRPGCESLLYRVARESLANINKHAHASNVEVELSATAEEITLTITDDGVGFDPTILSHRVAEGHIGIASQYLRVESWGGSFDVVSSPGTGTRVVVRIPPGSEKNR
ncbi:two-component system NarL family sensor kinase [Hoyosella altamirensis]|uniref:Two-component system NarL family sensor kinase n=1 Tax=Hoyosella altamirensis TaxID=616997 RepID=A0A839RLU4_9ACTN|nr:two-component system NarL family sensor kinase [Hoyosella altamirensis]